MAYITSVCRSERRGTAKRNITGGVLVENFGLEGDAHGGNWHRQVSLLSQDRIDAFNARGAGVIPGAFGENLAVAGLELRTLPVGCRLRVGERALLEITQIGKTCHSSCEIAQRMGECIMPKEGIFARVLRGGPVAVGDEVRVVWRAAVLTISDKGAAGAREDRSGPAVCALAEQHGYHVVHTQIIPDEFDAIAQALRALCDEDRADLILTTGGTGFAPRDVTPEATESVLIRRAPGIAEAMRAGSLAITPRAMLSRATAGIRARALVVNLPGSPKGAAENLGFVIDALGHGIALLKSAEGECAR
ncbi:MAG TPA: MOSC domain-containing protein [Candidatus Butyricicoccus stercorigallinarum]|nr:MOSC domain-containing protein [Candidatus Butyricicoccus stercorigallinarum]